MKRTAALMELHDENPFKIKSYNNAVFNLDRYEGALSELTLKSLEGIQGVGKSIAKAIDEINQTGVFKDLEALEQKTPAGLSELLGMKGIGAKKLRTVWQDLGIEDKDAMLDAANTGQLAKLKGFGAKTQENIRNVLLFQNANQGKLYYAEAEKIALEYEKLLQDNFVDSLVSITGEVRRKMEVVEEVKILIGTHQQDSVIAWANEHTGLSHEAMISGPYAWRGRHTASGVLVTLRFCAKDMFYNALLLTTSASAHLSVAVQEDKTLRETIGRQPLESEEAGYTMAGLPWIAPELREGGFEIKMAQEGSLPTLIEMNDIQGILHNHSTYKRWGNTHLRRWLPTAKPLDTNTWALQTIASQLFTRMD